ncbi:hypothetical protein ERO13_A13G111325v2, partial [Gossypium hirsutum]
LEVVIPNFNWGVFFNLPLVERILWNTKNIGKLSIQSGEWSTFFSIVCWLIWKNRNDCIFKNASSNSHELIASTEAWT